METLFVRKISSISRIFIRKPGSIRNTFFQDSLELWIKWIFLIQTEQFGPSSIESNQNTTPFKTRELLLNHVERNVAMARYLISIPLAVLFQIEENRHRRLIPKKNLKHGEKISKEDRNINLLNRFYRIQLDGPLFIRPHRKTLPSGFSYEQTLTEGLKLAEIVEKMAA
ncbi:MAG: hypothetical protein HYT77_05925 [Deltaproteobacteria bacterium]|nr:hypothetical protein [Deltaproteobacteria bacterium]